MTRRVLVCGIGAIVLEPLLRRIATHEIDAAVPLDDVVDQVERIAQLHTRT